MEWPLSILIARKFHDNTGRISPCFFCLWVSWLRFQLCLFSSPFHFPSCQVRLADVSTCRFKQLLYWHADACGMSFPVVACKSAFPSVPRQRSGCNGVHLQGDEATHRSRPGQTTISTFFHRPDRTLTILINFTHAYPIPSSTITIPLPLNS